jgi:hypothetical protein
MSSTVLAIGAVGDLEALHLMRHEPVLGPDTARGPRENKPPLRMARAPYRA